MTNTHNSDEQKKAIYTILDKMYVDKNYIDCAYEDICDLLATRDAELREKMDEILNELKDHNEL